MGHKGDLCHFLLHLAGILQPLSAGTTQLAFEANSLECKCSEMWYLYAASVIVRGRIV